MSAHTSKSCELGTRIQPPAPSRIDQTEADLESRFSQDPAIKVALGWVDRQCVGGFESDEIPDWVRESFDARTTLPRGPLEDFPIPLEGSITSGKALIPRGGEPARYVVTAACAESLVDTLRFYEEYLPLAGYVVIAQGQLRSRRNRLFRSDQTELVVLRRPPFVGTLTLRPPDEARSGTRIDVDVAHCHHPAMRHLVDIEELKKSSDVKWRSS